MRPSPLKGEGLMDGPRGEAPAKAGRRVAPEVFAVQVVPAGQPGLVAPGLQVDEIAPVMLAGLR